MLLGNESLSSSSSAAGTAADTAADVQEDHPTPAQQRACGTESVSLSSTDNPEHTRTTCSDNDARLSSVAQGAPVR